MKTALASDRGLVRETNQDSANIVSLDEHHLLACVCDGIGGAKAGEVASSMVIEGLSQSYQEANLATSMEAMKTWFVHTLNDINQKVFHYAQIHPDCQGMGTTLVACMISDDLILGVNVGDSRIYGLDREHQLQRITYDHSLVFDMMSQGQISEAQAEIHPRRNVLTNAMGIDPVVRLDFFELDSATYQAILLCSDGLHGYVSKDKITRVLENAKMDEAEKVATLVDLANDAGGLDNITCILIALENKS